MKQTIDNSSGFTLIEVLIASIIIVFGLLAMGTFLGNLVTKNAHNERKTMATSLAEQKIEDLRTLALQVNVTNPTHNGTDTIDNTGAGSFTRTWTIQEDAVGTVDRITVTVDWEGPSNSEVVLVTQIDN